MFFLNYRWITYEDLESTANYFGRGLRSLGLNPRDKICIFADTRSEWMMAAQGCFKQCFPLCTLYTNLGEEAVVHGLNQTQVNYFSNLDKMICYKLYFVTEIVLTYCEKKIVLVIEKKFEGREFLKFFGNRMLF